MKLRFILIGLALSFLLAGCGSWMDGSYVSVTPHLEQPHQESQQAITVSTYAQLRLALVNLVESGVEESVIYVGGLAQESLDDNIKQAIRYVTSSHPIGAYAVEEISYDTGTIGGQPALALTIQYLHNRAEIQRIKQTQSMAQAKNVITSALDNCDAGVILRITNYSAIDFAQFVSDYALENPHSVMEVPQVTVNIYPESGLDRVVELIFSYQTSRDTLRYMQSTVQPVFQSAELYVRGEASSLEKYSQLYSFLMERYDYNLETSITPTYSLLRHGVGDSKAFATVYAAMCQRAGLPCQVVSGTRGGESHFWNIISVDDVYYHVDLLQSSSEGAFHHLGDESMSGYVWDYSAHPACGVQE